MVSVSCSNDPIFHDIQNSVVVGLYDILMFFLRSQCFEIF